MEVPLYVFLCYAILISNDPVREPTSAKERSAQILLFLCTFSTQLHQGKFLPAGNNMVRISMLELTAD